MVSFFSALIVSAHASTTAIKLQSSGSEAIALIKFGYACLAHSTASLLGNSAETIGGSAAAAARRTCSL